MTDVTFVAAAYLVALGTFAVYAASLARRLRAARSARAAIERDNSTETIEAATQPQVH
jgi:hypothetical protein